MSDLLSTLIFVVCFALTHSIYAAAGLAIVLGLGQMVWFRFRGAAVDAMQWLSLVLVSVFGGATVLTRDPVFVMLKPTLIYLAVGAVMLRPGWMSRYIPPIATVHGVGVTIVFGYIWAALMFATAVANLAVASFASPTEWAWFIGVFPIASKIVLVMFQYIITRAIVRRRVRSVKQTELSLT